MSEKMTFKLNLKYKKESYVTDGGKASICEDGDGRGFTGSPETGGYRCS